MNRSGIFSLETYLTYQKEYFSFLQKPKKLTYKTLSHEILTSKNYPWVKLLYYKTNQVTKKRNFIIIPSIFNSPEILFTAQKDNFILEMITNHACYMIDWDLKYADPDISLSDLVTAITDILTEHNLTDRKLNIIGHCLGGNIALALTQHISLNSITLLTTAWDFSHLKHLAQLQITSIHHYLSANISHIPALYIEIMFFFMNPEHILNMVNKSLQATQKTKNILFSTQAWLASGQDLPRSLYYEILQDLCISNKFMQGKWIIEDKLFNPANINIPICIIVAQKDKIAPKNSIIYLHNILQNSKIIDVEGGHISYLIQPQPSFNIEYNNWLQTIL